MADKGEKGIATLFLTSGIIITVDELGKGELAPSRYFGLVSGFFLIAVIGSFNSEFARILAWLYLVAILVQRGPRVLDHVSKTARKGAK